MTHSFTLARSLARLRTAMFSTLFIFAGACDTDSLNPSSETEAGDELSEGSDAAPFADPAFSIAANRRGTQFGLWQLSFSQLSDQWTSLKKQVDPSTIRGNLEHARSKGARVFIDLAGDPKYYKTSTGKFSLEKFKQRLNRFKGVNIGTYITDGTFAGHILFDEPHNPKKWGGSPMPYDQVEAAARYSKSLWPNLPTLARTPATWLAKAGLTWRYLDGGWMQYTVRYGNVTSVRDAEVRAAKSKGLKVVFGLNVTNGGNGSSGWHGTKRGDFWKMSASEVLKYGKALIGAPTSCGFLMWRYDSDYLSKSGIRSAMKELRTLAGNTATTTCRSS
jgi:hypothetical protein